MAREGVDESKIIPYDQRPQSFNGVEVIQRQPGMLPHPHPSQNRRLVETQGVTHVLLANGFELHECEICLKTHESGRSIVAHLTAHNSAKSAPDYSEAVIRRVVQFATEERGRQFRGYGERAAERLNAAGLTRLDGKPFDGSTVSRMWSRYHEKYAPTSRRRAARNVDASVTAPPAAASDRGAKPRTKSRGSERTSTSAALDPQIAALFARIDAGIGRVRHELNRVEADLTTVYDQVSALADRRSVDPEVAEKAAKYDQMQQLLGR